MDLLKSAPIPKWPDKETQTQWSAVYDLQNQAATVHRGILSSWKHII